MRINGNCSPGFTAVPIGSPSGTKLCVRQLDPCGRRMGDTLHLAAKQNIRKGQGYYRGVLRLYDVQADTPDTPWNPQYYSSRRVPYEADLERADLLKRQMAYSGSGIRPLRIPHELKDADKPYWSYGLSYTPIEDPETGMRDGTKMSQAVAPPKWDINRLHQVYPRWKEEGLYLGYNRDKFDKTNTLRIV